MTAETLAQQFATLIDKLNRACDLVTADIPVDLEGLDGEVDLLCRAALKDGKAKELLPGMGQAIASLDALAVALKAQRDRLDALTLSTSPQISAKRAAAAYSQTGQVAGTHSADPGPARMVTDSGPPDSERDDQDGDNPDAR